MLLSLYKLFFAGMIRGQLLTFPLCDFVCPNFHLEMNLDSWKHIGGKYLGSLIVIFHLNIAKHN